MPKAITLGNGAVLIGLDRCGQIKDLYFHYAGLENHVSEKLVHKIGIMVDGNFSWIDSGEWKVTVNSEKDTMASDILAENSSAGLTLKFSDVVYNEKNIFLRQITIENSYDIARKIKFYFNQQFNISETHRRDTAYYDPQDNVVIHYKGRRVFLANAASEAGISDYGVGLLGIEGKDGTYKDAEDGKLSQNPIEHGQVDSVISIETDVAAKEKKTVYFWLTIGKSIQRVKELNKLVLQRGPADIIKTTKDFWRAWVHNQNFSFYGLAPSIVDLFNRSLITIRTHVNHNGSIIASGDSDMLQYGRDTYSYVWPRDAAFSSIALARAGDFNASRRFFEFCDRIITSEGYFMHKYRPDASLGSSWHPWVRDGEMQLPIQEDETALVIYALWVHFELSKDLEFIESIYNSLIKKSAEFMASYIDGKTGLPKASYDLWEEKYGISTFTASSVYAALLVSGRLAKLLGKEKSAAKYSGVAASIKDGIMRYLYNEKDGTFYKHINVEKDGTITIDKTIDISSIYGVYKFGVLKHDDEILKKAFDIFSDRLGVKTSIGGVVRLEGDQYHSFGGNVPGNPWFITTLWQTQYLIEFLKKESELPDIVKRFSWVVEKALPSGVLSEQLNPYSGEQVSAAPLIWSHAEYVITIIQYLEKLEELDICKACYPIA